MKSFEFKPAPHWVFVVLALTFGLTIALITPPNQPPDESDHISRAYQVAHGRLLATKIGNETGGYLPPALIHMPEEFDALQFRWSVKVADPIGNYSRLFHEYRLNDGAPEFRRFANTGVQSPLTFIPQAIGIRVAELFSDSVLFLWVMARISNLLVGVALVATAIALTPICKWVVAILALTPIALFQMSSASADCPTNALSFLYVAMLFRAAFGERRNVGWQEIAVLTLMGSAVAVAKIAYFPMILAVLLIPRSRFGTTGRWVTCLVASVVTATVVFASWSMVTRSLFSSFSEYADPHAQVHFMMAHPGTYVLALLKTTFVPWLFFFHVQQFVGVLGMLDTPMPWGVVAVHVLVVGLVAALDDSIQTPVIDWPRRLLAVAICVMVYIVVLTAAYVTWMNVGADWMVVQSRYFIPFEPLLLLILYGLARKLSSKSAKWTVKLPLVLPVYMALLCGFTVYMLLGRYYVL